MLTFNPGESMLLNTSPKTRSAALILLITLLLPHGRIAALDEQAQQEAPVSSEPKKAITDIILTPAIIASLAFIIWITAPEEVQEKLINQLTPGKLAANFAKEYSSWALATLSHEAGHALVQSLATGRPSTIHLGASKPTGKPPFFTIGNLHVDGLEPHAGYTPLDFTSQEEKQEFIAMVKEACRQAKEVPQAVAIAPSADIPNPFLPDRRLYAIFLLAGGLSGLLANHARQGLFSKEFRIDGITINQLCNALIPNDKNSDGAALWRDCVGVPPAVINAIIEISDLFGIAGEMYVATRDPRSQNSPILSKLLVGLLNYFSRGYLRFHV